MNSFSSYDDYNHFICSSWRLWSSSWWVESWRFSLLTLFPWFSNLSFKMYWSRLASGFILLFSHFYSSLFSYQSFCESFLRSWTSFHTITSKQTDTTELFIDPFMWSFEQNLCWSSDNSDEDDGICDSDESHLWSDLMRRRFDCGWLHHSMVMMCIQIQFIQPFHSTIRWWWRRMKLILIVMMMMTLDYYNLMIVINNGSNNNSRGREREMRRIKLLMIGSGDDDSNLLGEHHHHFHHQNQVKQREVNSKKE